MSWDVLVLNVPTEIRSASDIPADFSNPLATTSEIHSVLGSLFGDIDLSDPHWAILERPTYSIEFSIGRDDPVQSVALHVRGADEAIEAIVAFCNAGHWRAIDFGAGEFIDFDDDPAAGLRSWRAYSEQAISAAAAGGKTVQIRPNLGGVIADAAIIEPPTKKWWQFWK